MACNHFWKRLLLLALVTSSVLALPSPSPSPSPSSPATGAKRCAGHAFYGPVLNRFPDPSLLKIGNTYHSFATGVNGANGSHIDMASSTDFKTWTLRGDAIPDMTSAAWSSGPTWAVWAPDVMQRTDKTFLMYFAANDSQAPGQHCIGVATYKGSTPIPTQGSQYEPLPTLWGADPTCYRDKGGIIDPAFFRDTDATDCNIAAYVVYKIDGGHKGTPTSLWLQEVHNNGADEGIATIGQPTLLLTSDPVKDGSYGIEAPYLVRRQDIYYLFFSTHLYSDGSYDIQYATSTSVAGTYVRQGQILATGNYSSCNYPFWSPGGASLTSTEENKVVFANIPAQKPPPAGMRSLMTGELFFSGTSVTWATSFSPCDA